jgi:uncharacterized phiE125 gp8 family phage protein
MRLETPELETAECILLAEAKLHCRVDSDAEDDWFDEKIPAARQFVEKFIDGAVLPQTIIAYYDAIEVSCFDQVLNLPVQPVISIASVTSYDSADAATVFSSSNYRLSGNRIALGDSANWPTNLRNIDSVAIEFLAGFGTESVVDEETVITAVVPEDIKQAMLLVLAHWYQNREAAYDPLAKFEPQKESIPYGVRALLMPYRHFSL